MFFGVSNGGRRIVENIGNNTIKLDNVKGILSDISTALNLFLASLFGLPVSTTHVKTASIIGLGEKDSNFKNIKNIFKSWILTFPICFLLSYFLTKISLICLKIS